MQSNQSKFNPTLVRPNHHKVFDCRFGDHTVVTMLQQSWHERHKRKVYRVGLNEGKKEKINRNLVVFCDASQRAKGSAGASPLNVPSVLSWTQEVLAPPVVGVFMEHPVALHDIDRGDVTRVETLIEIRTVFHHLHILSCEVRTLKDLHPVVSVVLQREKRKGKIVLHV